MDFVVNKIKKDIKDKHTSVNIDSYELFYTSHRIERISVSKKKLINLSIDCNKGMAFRCITAKGLGVINIEKIDDQTAHTFVHTIKSNSNYFVKDKRLMLSNNEEKQIEDIEENRRSSIEEKRIIALEIEDTCYKMDKRVVDLKNLTISSRQSLYNIYNSNGIDYISKHGLETVLVQILLNNDFAERDVVGMAWINNLQNFNIDLFIGNVIKQGVDLLGAKKVEIGRYNVVFDAQTSSKIWKEFVPFFYANHDSASPNKLNTLIASENLSISDYATYKGSYTNFLFDSEGVLVSDVELITNGILRNYLHNQSTAEKFRTCSTGNGFRESYLDNYTIKSKNFFITNSDNSKNKNMLERLENGILITEINNAIAKRADVNGTILLVCSGHLIKNAQKVSPCQHVCIALNIHDFLTNIADLGDDHFIRYSPSGTIICPSLLIRDVLVR